ncbi:metal-dependent hydrolase family protein [Amycolatopsis pretoriensis]|uniref:metal-dependent hydrolase family protein n=1 Tax=Amycolatopsis pretoriensis TaxID=218821 RepID=UPI001FC94881|nr:amidohydrolase family protein [Amycolatopsis pretoriensis]
MRQDFPGSTILPGLINCHVHLVFDPGQDPVAGVHDVSEADLLERMARHARQLLDAGVTTVRDLGDRDGLAIRLRDRVNAGELPGPRIVAAGPPITVPQGHCWFLGGEADGERELRDRVRRTAALGADLIKVMVSGGSITPNSPAMWASQFTPAELRTIVEEASAAGLPVAAHAHGTEAIAAAVDAGVTTIEHCTWLRDGGGGYDTRDDVAERMAGRGIHACVAWPPDWPGFLDRFGRERAALIIDRFRWMNRVGIPLIPGTDAGLGHSPFTEFAGALGLYEHVGFPRERIIEMATVVSAGALGLDGKTGRLATCHSADLLVVPGDPLTDLGVLGRQESLVVRGQTWKPAAASS